MHVFGCVRLIQIFLSVVADHCIFLRHSHIINRIENITGHSSYHVIVSQYFCEKYSIYLNSQLAGLIYWLH